jgi:hypothetical protein
VKLPITLNSKIAGIICAGNQMATGRDILWHTIDDIYSLGDILTVDASGLCKKATGNEGMS